MTSLKGSNSLDQAQKQVRRPITPTTNGAVAQPSANEGTDKDKFVHDICHSLNKNLRVSICYKRTPMATGKEQAPAQGTASVEEERVEKELDGDAQLQLCRQHCGGVPASYGADDRKPRVVCTEAEVEDGSGDASSAGKCEDIKQQADHYKCAG
ncbi:Unknown protein [Striga hermonthica]|uniref:Uncharacterized protein n=1 Tax=Striga hermonthica TaxID=68872 RepID=A0A9N7MTN5_STRHE|nr:Unknown protein [Striga hermonthica]